MIVLVEVDSRLFGLGFGVYLSVVKAAGESAEMEIVLSKETRRNARFISQGNIAITEGQNIEMFLRFMPATGVQTFAELSIDYEEKLGEWHTIASCELRNSEYNGYFIGIGCAAYEIYLNDTTTPGYFTFKEPGDYLIKAQIQGASDELRVRVFPEEENGENGCLGTMWMVLIFLGSLLIHTIKYRSADTEKGKNKE